MILLRGAVPIATSTYAWRAKRARGELVLADALADPRHISRQKLQTSGTCAPLI
jgi:hypothetical protein